MSTPVKLGIAGGPIIVGILMGAFGPRFHLTTYTTMSANLMLRHWDHYLLAGLGSIRVYISSKRFFGQKDCFGSGLDFC